MMAGTAARFCGARRSSGGFLGTATNGPPIESYKQVSKSIIHVGAVKALSTIIRRSRKELSLRLGLLPGEPLDDL